LSLPPLSRKFTKQNEEDESQRDLLKQIYDKVAKLESIRGEPTASNQDPVRRERDKILHNIINVRQNSRREGLPSN